jgi:hypothetical protein
VYVRLKSGLTGGSYSGNVSISGGGVAEAVTVAVSGTVTAPKTTTLPYSEDFSTDLGDIYVYDAAGSNHVWARNAGGSAFINGFGSATTQDDWLILPGFDADAYANPVLTFDSYFNFGVQNETNFLKLYYSTDYFGVGDPSSATWTELAFTLPSVSQVFVSSGKITLSEITGSSVYIAFRYYYESDYREWRIDNISLTNVVDPTVNTSVSTLTNFGYEMFSGPSVAKSFSIEGIVLDGTNISVAGAADYEFSLNENSGFVNPLSVTYTGSTLNAATIYVRLKSGLSTGTYNQNLSITGAGLTEPVIISLTGSVSSAGASIGTEGYTENFANFGGTGFSPSPTTTQLDSRNWAMTGWSDGALSFDETRTSGDFARGASTGAASTGGIYAFTVADGVKSLGFQPGGSDFAPGTVTLRLRNTTGEDISALELAYDLYVYNDQGRSSSFNFSYSTNNSDYTSISSLDYTSPEAADSPASWVKNERKTVITGLNVADGDFMYFRWSSADVAGGGSRDEFGLTNISIKSTNAVALTGVEGYRLLSTPVTTSFASFLAPIWTQGATGADATFGNPNVFTWNNTSTTDDAGNWVGVTNLNQNITAGTGFMVYVFADDNYDGSADAFPKVLNVSGVEHANDTAPSVNANANGWTLLGNPFAETVRFSNMSKSNLRNTVYVWDANHTTGTAHSGSNNPGAGTWRTHGGGNGDHNGDVAPFQAFFVQNTGSGNGTVTFGAASRQGTGGTFHGKDASPSAVRMELRGDGFFNSAWVAFNDEGALELTYNDTYELMPLSMEYALFGTEKAGKAVDVGHYPVSDFEEYIIPVVAEASRAGNFTINVTDFSLPDGLHLTFVDTQTGEELPMNGEFSYDFGIDRVAKRAGNHMEQFAKSGPVVAETSAATSRFQIKVSRAGTTSVETGGVDAPLVTELYGNYPNPFNPTTRIQYALPFASHVRLEVFDLMGRRVALLVDGEQRAGSQFVNFDAASLSSGVYVYRLTAAGQTITRKMTLVK